MSDLQERLVKALPYYHEGTSHEAELFYSVEWWRCQKCGVQWYGTQVPAICKPLPPAIDWSVVPVIDAAIEARRWTWRKYTRFAALFTPTDQFRSAPSETANYDFPVALAEVFCTAVENVTKYNS